MWVHVYICVCECACASLPGMETDVAFVAQGLGTLDYAICWLSLVIHGRFAQVWFVFACCKSLRETHRERQRRFCLPKSA